MVMKEYWWIGADGKPFKSCLIARWFAVLEVSETPTARCGVFFVSLTIN
jgi:hypothetical protein